MVLDVRGYRKTILSRFRETTLESQRGERCALVVPPARLSRLEPMSGKLLGELDYLTPAEQGIGEDPLIVVKTYPADFDIAEEVRWTLERRRTEGQAYATKLSVALLHCRTARSRAPRTAIWTP